MATTDRRGVTVDATDTPIAGDPNPGLAIKAPALVATTGNIVLAGAQTVDGVAVGNGERVLVWQQTDQTQNGLYNASSGNWTRTIDLQTNDQIANGLQVAITSGNTYSRNTFEVTAADPITLGLSNVTFVQTTVSVNASLQILNGQLAVAPLAPIAHEWVSSINAQGIPQLTQPGVADIANGQALTRANDTNVTLTLGGGASAALLSATSLTLGWTGTLGLSRGGLGASQTAATANQVPVYPGSGGGAVPTGLSALFDAVFSSTVGRFLVRASSGWIAASMGYANPVWWGADPTGASDSTSAFNSALAASSFIYFPPGKFKFASQVVYSLPAGIASVTIAGAGADNTILYWPTNTGGIKINYSAATHSAHVRDLTLSAGTAGNGQGLNLNNTVAEYNFAQSDVINVTFRGDDGGQATDYWTTCVQVSVVSNINFINCLFYGPSSGGSGNGVALAGSGSVTNNYGLIYNFQQCAFFNVGNGILYGSYVQGLTVNQCNFVNGLSGIWNTGTTGVLSQLTVTNSNFNVQQYAVVLNNAGVDAAQFIGNLVYVQPGFIGFDIAVNDGFLAVGNQFTYVTTINTGTGISVATTGSTTPNLIADNAFFGQGTAINLLSGSQNVIVSGNAYASNTTNTADAGTNNKIFDDPKGVSVAANVGTSPWTYTAGAHPETHYLRQNGTNAATVAKGSQQIATLANASTYYAIDLLPHESYTVTWATTTPTYTKDVH